MPWPAERHRGCRHRWTLFFEPAPQEHEAISLIDIRARRRNVAVVRRAAAVARYDVAIVEHRLTGAENEIDVAPHIAFGEIGAAGVGKEGVLIANDSHIHERRAIAPEVEHERHRLHVSQLRWI